MTVKGGELERLMVDERKDAVFLAKQGIKTSCEHKKLLISCVWRGHAFIGSGETPGASGHWGLANRSLVPRGSGSPSLFLPTHFPLRATAHSRPHSTVPPTPHTTLSPRTLSPPSS